MNKYQDPRWQKLRLKVFERDNFTCKGCGAKDKPLHAHHIRYCGEIWESPLEDLVTQCKDCHASLGEHPKGGVYKDGGVVFLYHCPNCNSNLFGITRRKTDLWGSSYWCKNCFVRLGENEFSCVVIPMTIKEFKEYVTTSIATGKDTP